MKTVFKHALILSAPFQTQVFKISFQLSIVFRVSLLSPLPCQIFVKADHRFNLCFCAFQYCHYSLIGHLQSSYQVHIYFGVGWFLLSFQQSNWHQGIYFLDTMHFFPVTQTHLCNSIWIC